MSSGNNSAQAPWPSHTMGFTWRVLVTGSQPFLLGGRHRSRVRHGQERLACRAGALVVPVVHELRREGFQGAADETDRAVGVVAGAAAGYHGGPARNVADGLLARPRAG